MYQKDYRERKSELPTIKFSLGSFMCSILVFLLIANLIMTSNSSILIDKISLDYRVVIKKEDEAEDEDNDTDYNYGNSVDEDEDDKKYIGYVDGNINDENKKLLYLEDNNSVDEDIKDEEVDESFYDYFYLDF